MNFETSAVTQLDSSCLHAPALAQHHTRVVWVLCSRVTSRFAGEEEKAKQRKSTGHRAGYDRRQGTRDPPSPLSPPPLRCRCGIPDSARRTGEKSREKKKKLAPLPRANARGSTLSLWSSDFYLSGRDTPPRIPTKQKGKKKRGTRRMDAP